MKKLLLLQDLPLVQIAARTLVERQNILKDHKPTLVHT
jgi:hypothetical protein